MKSLNAALALLALTCCAGAAHAQYVPKHPKYVEYISGGRSFAEYFPSWTPGQELSADENFFISRVRLKDRFVNRASQVVPDNAANNQRKFSLCTPMGISDTYWQTLPRGVMDGDNFGMWSYIDFQDGWSQSWIRNVGAYSDVCHKNGVQNSGGVVFFDSWGGDNSGSNAVVNMLTTKNSDGTFKYLDKFVQFLRYYGIDGVTFNPEGKVPNAATLQDFFIAVREKCASYGMKFHVNWYAVSANDGTMTLASVLNPNHQNWFVKNGKEVCDVYFLNYDWTSSIQLSTQTAERLKAGSTNNLFAGYDIQGNWMGRGSWTALANTNMSICFWGNHTTDMIYQNSTELGSSDENVQRNYLTKQEQVFSGGNRNPAATPAIKDGVGSSSTAAMKSFHGVAALMPARSTLQELPFVTRFSLGNGKVFRSEGNVTFNNKWYSLSSQDYLPTWRWWITDAAGNVPSDAVECSFTFDDSWYAGSCMTVSGATNTSNVRLFKTNFNVSDADEVSLRFKLLTPDDAASHARLFWSFVGSESELHYADITADAQNTWGEWTKTAGEIGMTGHVAVLGLCFTDTPQDYKMLVGEMGIVPQHTYVPVKPTIKRFDFLERNYNNVSYKLIWDCGKSDASKADPSVPTYNDDVDTWYFEVYSQAKGQPEKLDGVTTSWAHYIVGAYAEPDVTEYRFGVRAVAPDGRTASEITWTDWQTTDISYVEGVTVDRPVIKQGETFTASFTDPTHPAAGQWRIVDPATGQDVVTPASDATSITGSIDRLGTYDLIVSPDGGDASTPKNPATAQVLGTSDIVDGGIYYIYTTARGGLTVKSTSDSRLWGTSESGVNQTVSASNPLQHFQFEKSGSNYYLKSVATGKYVSKTQQGTLVSSISQAAPVYFANPGSGSVRLYFDASYNINLGGDKQVVIDNWTTKDDGNKFIIKPAELSGAPKAESTVYRGLIQVSPAETGSVPAIADFTAAKTRLARNDQTTLALSTTLGEGKVSRGLQMDDGLQLCIPAEALPASQKQYSVGFWVKPDLFAHSKYGTNLINKRNVDRGWPHNNWGAFWVICWPQQFDGSNVALDDNVISYTLYNSESGNQHIAGTSNANIHETPYYRCTTDRHLPCGETYALQPETWSHVMITYDGSTQSIYFNGKKAVSCAQPFVQYDESPIYIGGSNVYHAGIKGTIDDVQVWHKALSDAEVLNAMKGYEGQAAPAELKAYYTFEETNGDNTFPNHGSGAASLKAAYVKLEGAAGENTSGTQRITVEPVTNVLGNPTLPGSLEVKTTATLTTSAANANALTGILPTITSPTEATLKTGLRLALGAYDVTLTLSNMWGAASLTKAGYITVALPGDINMDGQVNTADVDALVNYLLGNAPARFDAIAADVNGDGFIGISDVAKLIATLKK